MEEQRPVTSTDSAISSLKAEIEGLRELLKEVDRRYTQRFDLQDRAIGAAMSAQEKAVSAAFESSEKAIVKAEEAQKAYNVAHNDLARKMDDQNKATMPRHETEIRFQGMEDKLSNVRDMVGGVVNRGVGIEKAWGWIVAAAGSGGVAAWLIGKAAQ